MAASGIASTVRQCGGCTLCCKVLAIEALAKPMGQWCPHCTPGSGCKIYETRPEECRTFSCNWLLDPTFPEDWRPDHSRLVFFPDQETRNILVHVDPGTPDAWRREPYHSWLRSKAAEGLNIGASVVVSVGRNATLVLPHGEQYLGVVNSGDQIVISKAMGPDGMMLEVKVIRHTPSEELEPQ
ncbi:MAG: hypothetical protein ABSD74_10565 [Rhizomicrobium sp.]